MGILDPILSFLLGPIDPPAKDPLLAAGGVVKRAFPDLERSQRGDVCRMVYLASVLHVGRHGVPIFRDAFEATCYGPIVPRLLDDLRRHVPRCLDPMHDRALPTSALACLDEVCDAFRDMRLGATTAATQRAGGGWEANFRSGRHVDRGVIISTADMASEYAVLYAEPIAA